MNKLSLHYQREQEPGQDEWYWRVIVKVDAEPVVDFRHYELAADLEELQKSAEGEGEFFIIACSCGEPQCAGIQEGIKVLHQGDRVIWVYRNPLPDPATQPELVKPTASRRPEWAVRGVKLPTKTFVFDRAEYVSAIRQGISRGVQLLQQCGPESQIVPAQTRRLLEAWDRMRALRR